MLLHGQEENDPCDFALYKYNKIELNLKLIDQIH